MDGKITGVMQGVMLAMALFLSVEGKAQRAPERGQWKDDATMQRLIETYFDGVAAKNFVTLDSVVTRDFLIYEDGKVWNNDSVFHNIQYHEPFEVKFTLTDFDIFADARSGEARYHEQADFVILDTVRFTLNFLSTALFRRTRAGWRIRLIHVTGEKSREVTMPSYYRAFDTVRYIPEHYRERLEAFGKEPGQPGATVMLGTSITEYGDWKRWTGDPNVVNRGIAGDNTFGMLHRLGDVIAQRPRRLLIEAGINDIGQNVPAAMIAGNIGSMVQYVRVKSPGTRVCVISVLPTNGQARQHFPAVAGKNEQVRKVDSLLREAAGRLGYRYIDLAAKLTDGEGDLDRKYSSEDGLHLNPEGYRIFGGLVQRI